jgi:predicted outer membrane lipoprotein
MPSETLLGPFALLAAALLTVAALWREHLKADADDRAQRDVAQSNNQATKELLRQSLVNNAAAIEAWNKRIELDAARRRRADRP